MMRLSIFDRQGVFEQSWFVPGVSPGKVMISGDSLLIPLDLVLRIGEDYETNDGAIHVFSTDGDYSGSFGQYPELRMPNESPFLRILGAESEGVVAWVPFSRNELTLRNLATGEQREISAAPSAYQPPDWPAGNFKSIPELQEWAPSQMWTHSLTALGDGELIIGFFTELEDEKLITYGIFDMDGRELGVSTPTDIVIHRKIGERLYGSRMLGNGDVHLVVLSRL